MLTNTIKMNKTLTSNKINKKGKRFSFWKVFSLFVISTIISSSIFYVIEIQPKMSEAEKVIQENKDYIISIAPDKNYESVLFNNNYTEKDFKDDLNLFEKIYGDSIRDPERKKSLIGGGDGPFRSLRIIMMMHALNKNYSYEYLYNEHFYYKEAKTADIDVSFKISQEKKQNLRKIFKSRNLDVIMAEFGMEENKKTTDSYNNLNNAFTKKYGDNSYLDTFVRKYLPYESKEELRYREENKNINKTTREKIIKAYENKDYETLKIYFKQNREFVNYLAGFKIGSLPYSYWSNENISQQKDNDNITKLVFNALLFKGIHLDNSNIKNEEERTTKVIGDLTLY